MHDWVCQWTAYLAQKSPSMKNILAFLFCAGFVAAGEIPAAAQPDLIARIHFDGAGTISTGTNSAAFTNLFCSAEARALASQTLDKLARAPSAWFKNKIPAGAGDGSAQLRPLLDDLLKSEWVLEISDATNGSPEYALAVRLSNEREQLWQNNLSNLLESWTKLPAQKIPNGWELRKHQPPNRFRFQRNGDWVVIGCGQDELPLSGQILQPFLKLSLRAKETDWLSADLNWPRLAQVFPVLKQFDFPKIEMQVAGTGGNLWLNGKFILSQPLASPGQWRMPVNTIHAPFISFTAARGVAPWLERQNWAQRFDVQPPPDQFFIWALPQVPFQTFAAVPVSNANAALAQLDAEWSASLNMAPQTSFFSPFTVVMTNNVISWQNVPFISPFVQALHEKSGDFLLGGFFPNSPRSAPFPPELLAQLNVPNMVYYHWEVTSERLPQLLNLSQLGLALSRHKQLGGESAAVKWLNRIGPALGNATTGVTQTAPNELSFTRKAPCGLTAAELLALANWLDAPNFPGCDLHLVTRPQKSKRPQIPGAPSAQPPGAPQPPQPH
jgi:hypothetical protein